MKTSHHFLCILMTAASVKIPVCAVAAPPPALVLCADVNVFDAAGNRVTAPNSRVHFWGDARGPVGGREAVARHRWFEALESRNQPTLTAHHGRSWIRFDGKNQWMTLGQVLDSSGLEKIPMNTMLVVMSSNRHHSAWPDPVKPHQPAVTPDNPQVIDIPNDIPKAILKNNPPQTIIGDQSFSVFGELGLAQTARKGFWIFPPRIKALSYRWSYANTGMVPDGSGTITYAANDTQRHDVTTGSPHVLAVTHQTLTGLPPQPLTVRLFRDGTKVFDGNPPAGSAVGMTCIGGGYAGATVNSTGHDVPANFLHAYRLFDGDIAAVLAYDTALKEEEVENISRSLLRNPDACEQLGKNLKRLNQFHPHR